MRTIAPRIYGSEEITIAEDQLNYSPIVAALVRYGNGETVRVCRWTFTPSERARVAAGEDVYFGTPTTIPLTPHWLAVGFAE